MRFFILISIFLTTSTLSSVTKTDFDLFQKWIKIQRIYTDQNLSAKKAQLNNEYLQQFKKCYESLFLYLKELMPFLKSITNNQIHENGYYLKTPLDEYMQAAIAFCYDALEHNSPAFIDFLQEHQFCRDEKNQQDNNIIEKNKAFLRLLFADKSVLNEDECLFAVANRIFEYCFSAQTFSHHQRMVSNASTYPIARFLYSTLWYHLIGSGWKHWHKDTLDALKTQANAGARIYYLAGGNDIYQLLKHGIYNITVIDPFFPSQERYYAENWQWLIKGEGNQGGLHDVIECFFNERPIFLKRTAYTPGETFHAKLSTGNIAELKKSITEWSVHDARTSQQLGTLVFDRRCVQQHDFVAVENRAIVMSYDEMIYAAIPESIDGWGIDPSLFDNNFRIFIKQLRKPVSKTELQNIRIISLINLADLKFVSLASDPR